MDVEFKKLCTPARIYFALSIVSCLLMIINRVPILAIAIKLVFAFLWAYVLGWLCRKGYKSISWFLVLLPFIMIFLAYFGILRHMRQVDKLNPLVN